MDTFIHIICPFVGGNVDGWNSKCLNGFGYKSCDCLIPGILHALTYELYRV